MRRQMWERDDIQTGWDLLEANIRKSKSEYVSAERVALIRQRDELRERLVRGDSKAFDQENPYQARCEEICITSGLFT
eukprot:2381988-Pyramimonas_sp.AAC.1